MSSHATGGILDNVLKLFPFSNIVWNADRKLESVLRLLVQTIDNGGRILEKIELLDGHRLTGIVIPAATETTIEHKLGRQIRGWIVTETNNNTALERRAWDDKHLVLYAASAVTIDLWVF